jgi:tetratricopeptide (TPR) repeat protein
MAMSFRQGLLLSVLLSAGAREVRAQQPPLPADRPKLFVPLQPETRADLDRRDAHKLYAMGLLRQRQDRLVDAVRYLEEARQLDPDSAPVQKALVPLYLALGRQDDALAACRKSLDRDPADYETWYLYARQLREQGRPKESLEALTQGIACSEAKEHLDILVQMYYDQGTLSEEAKNWAQAESAYRAVIDILVDRRPALLDSGPFNPEQLDGEAAKTQEHIGQVCIKAGKYAAAIKAFTAAQKLNPDQAGRLNFNLAEVCMARKQPAEALPYLDAYLRTQPQGTQPYEMKIDILKQLHRDNEILPALQQYAERDRFNVALQMLVARQYGHERQWDEAERRYEKLADQTASSDVYRGLFELYKEQAKAPSGRGMAKALTTFDKAVAAATPKEEGAVGDPAAAARARAMLGVIREDADLLKGMLQEAVTAPRAQQGRSHSTWRLLGALAAKGRHWDMAERLYKDCLDGITAQNEAEVYGGLLDVLSEARKYDEVIKYCQEGLKAAQATNRVLFYAKLMVAHVQLNHPNDALAAADEAVKLADDRNRTQLQRMRINVLSEIGRYEQAVKECQALLKNAKQADEERDLRYSLSGVYSNAKDYAKAEEQLRLILATDPNDATANNDLGYIMADQGKNLEESEKLVRRAIELDREEKKSGTEVRSEGDGDNAAYLDSLGWVLFRRGQFAEARDWLEKATALPGGDDDPVVWDHLGDVYAKSKQPARARAAWEKAVQLYEQEKRRKPDDRYKEVKQKLKEVTK